MFELFEIFNDKSKRVFFTYSKDCVPPKEQFDSMLKNGYKIKINGTTATKKRLNELIK